jgi:hypothetical protein
LAIQEPSKPSGSRSTFVAPDDAVLGKLHGRYRGVVGLWLEPKFCLAEVRRRVDPQAAVAEAEGCAPAVRLEVLQPEHVAIERDGLIELVRRHLQRDVTAAAKSKWCRQGQSPAG